MSFWEGRKLINLFLFFFALLVFLKKEIIMSREEAIKALLGESENESVAERLDRIEKKFDLILSVIVVQQKDFCEAIGMSPDTVRNKVLSGDIEML